MKTKSILCTIALLLITSNSQAQFLKKLEERAKDAFERTVLNKTDEVVSKKTGESIDSITKGGKKTKSKKIGETEKNTGEKTSEEEQKAKEQKIMSMFGGGLEGIPETYDFTYLMEMTLEANKESLKTQYYLKPNTNYFGNSIQENPNSIIVFDMEHKAMVTFMDDGQQKMAMKMSMNIGEKMQKKIDQKLKSSKDKNEEFQVTPIGSKTILGYLCDGYQVITKEGTSKFWITNEAPVSMTNIFSNENSMPNNLKGLTLPFTNKTSILEMNFESNKRKKDNVHMLCTKLIKNQLTINKKDYQSGN